MKTIHQYIYVSVLSFIFVLGSALTASAQTDSNANNQTVSFKVYGVCGECKERIESAALDAKGVKKAEWDVQSDILVLVGSSKMDKMKVAKVISKAGYKSEFSPADKKGYDKLPACCQYDESAEKH
jgi:mercuric ion binding protein